MKKFRLLAALLAILMLPFGMLAACKEDDTPPSPGPNKGDNGDNPANPGGNTGGTTDVVYDDDGTNEGYLMFFDFDAAERGDFKFGTKPYSDFFSVTSDIDNFEYLIDDTAGKNGGALVLQRENSEKPGATALKVSLANLKNSITANHTLEFDIKVASGYITEDINITGAKESGSLIFATITDKGVCDGDGNMLYAYSETDRWITVAIGIDDENRTYNIYVNGAKLTAGIEYKTSNYLKWSEEQVIEYAVKTEKLNSDCYLYLDNIGIRGVSEPAVRDESNDNMTYTDSVVDTLSYYESTKEYYKAMLNDVQIAHMTIYKPYQNFRDDDNLKVLPLADTFAMTRYNETTKKFTKITFDTGVELGSYIYGIDFGNKAFKLDDNNYFFFKSNHELEFSGKYNGNEISGNYVLGTDKVAKCSVTWISGTGDNATTQTRYIKYVPASGSDAESIAVYKDETLCILENNYPVDTKTLLPFSGKDYGFAGSNTRLVLSVYDYIGKAKLVIEGANTVEADNIEYTYADGVLSFTVGETAYSFTYNAETDEFTYQETTFGAYDPWELMDDEYLCTYYANYKSFQKQPKFVGIGFMGRWDADAWQNIRMRYYIPEEGQGYNFIFRISAGTNNGGASYWDVKNVHYSTGWQEYSSSLNAITTVTKEPSGDRVDGTLRVYTGGVNGTGEAGGVDKNAVDGYGFYIRDIMYVERRTVIVEGPAEGMENCTHSTFEDIEEPVAGTCIAPGYYTKKCTACGTVKVDDSKPVIASEGHIVDTTVAPSSKLPTCYAAGYKYRVCQICGDDIVTEKLDSKGHINHSAFDASENKMITSCTVCGLTTEFILSEKLMTGIEKKNALELSDFTQALCVAEGVNEYFFNGGYKMYSKGNTGSGYGMEASPKGASIKTGVMPNGVDYGWEHKRTSAPSDPNGLFDINPDDTLERGAPLVFEVDIMLGRKASDGKYMMTSTDFLSRTGDPYTVNIYKTDGEGNLIMVGDNTCKVKLSDMKYTNFAFACNFVANTIDVYVDGVLTFTDIPLKKGADLTTYQVTDIRFWAKGDNVANEAEGQASMCYNNVMYYNSETPVCVLSFGGETGDEYKGTIALRKPDGTTNGPELSITDAPVKLDLPPYNYTTKYVLDFSITADALTEGAILTGHKRDQYEIVNAQELLTVKAGYIYYLGVAICKVEEAVDGVRITMAFEDNLTSTAVYVDGVEVPGGRIPYPNGVYGEATSVIEAFTFDNAAGSYEITGLEMYTGSLKAAE